MINDDLQGVLAPRTPDDSSIEESLRFDLTAAAANQWRILHYSQPSACSLVPSRALPLSAMSLRLAT
jgi:hypothetical protein